MTGTSADKARASKRSFLASHPWITFSLDVRNVDRHFWQRIGEARSKCRHLMLTPLKPAVAAELEALYLAKGVQGTTAIEGNTLTLDQVRAAVAGNLEVPRSQDYLKREVDNILSACREIEEGIAANGRFDITVDLLCSLNERVLRDLELDDHVVPGKFREVRVGVGSYLGAPPDDVAYLSEIMCEWLNGPDFDVETADRRDAFLLTFLRAIAAHVYIAWIHPFGDGNGRTARLVEFGILTAAGIPSVAAHLLSNHYNLTRTAYYRQLDHASGSGGELAAFLGYAVEGLVDLLQEQLHRVHHEIFSYSWENLVHEHFRHRSTATGKRQRDLVIALGREGHPIPRDRLPEITPALAAAYAQKQSKTLTRDINAIVRAGLVERTPHGIRARPEIMFGFTPRLGGAQKTNVLLDREIEEEPLLP